MDVEKVGKAISYLRKRAGYTQKDLADRIGISDKAVSKWERGLGLPEIGYLRKLSILLDTDTDSLLAGGIHNDSKWQGILVLEPNEYNIGADIIIYDKPIINILLGYFLLVGIKNIFIICSEKDELFINHYIGNGENLGVQIECYSGDVKDIIRDNKVDAKNIMMVYGRCLLYGVEQTRFFQRAMTNKNRLTILILPQKVKNKELSIHVDADMRVINSNTAEPIRKQYDYCMLPVLFFPKTMLDEIIQENNISDFIAHYIRKNEIYVEMMDRGFVKIELNNWENIHDASAFMKIVQNMCGMNIYCIEEIAWRRGYISLEQLKILGERIRETEYGEYIISLYNRTMDIEKEYK